VGLVEILPRRETCHVGTLKACLSATIP